MCSFTDFNNIDQLSWQYLDIAKNTFPLHGADYAGKAVLKKRLSRHKLAAYAATLPACTIVMEGSDKLTF
jgi:hypothetical protein